MPVIKPVYTAISTAPVATGGVVTTTVNPVVSRFFATITAGMIGATDTTIPAASFIDDAEDPVTTLPALTADDYANVYVNGVLQQSSLSTITTTELVLGATDISVGVPVLLEIASFTNTSSNITTQPTISAPTITIIT
ncbi:DUF4183 domain-containing protein [Paenibacillus oenotherae]|uniref:DUF4183 domain-containing protein n=1 Tax=Paenibacillus oenotherae TaxID=1435645 RepID=A0ABS7D6G9_9BACL|nr:DUF4183 domain-containing protein [Paenibacillus oenotherae]MBW7474758.1 DUF4183 domain-containing protein [Paenibacillus oenotherae]